MNRQGFTPPVGPPHRSKSSTAHTVPKPKRPLPPLCGRGESSMANQSLINKPLIEGFRLRQGFVGRIFHWSMSSIAKLGGDKMKTPRYLRYAIFSIAVLLFACVSNPTLATEYPGGFVEWTQPGTVVGLCPVVDTGQITNVSLFINSASTSRGFENNTMVLITPDGT